MFQRMPELATYKLIQRCIVWNAPNGEEQIWLGPLKDDGTPRTIMGRLLDGWIEWMDKGESVGYIRAEHCRVRS